MSAVEYNISKRFTDLSLFFIGQQDCEPNHEYSIVYNDRYLIHYILRGKGKFFANNRVYNLKEGNAFLIGGGNGGRYIADSKEPWSYVWINLNGDIASEFLKNLGLDSQNPIYTSTAPEKTNKCFRSLTESIYEKNKFTLYAQLFNTFGEMINYSANPIVEEKTKSSQYVELAKQYIKANYFKQITVDELCKLAGVERSYLFRLFKAQTGLSPMEYIIQYKMKKAAVILCENNISISETALAVGYDDKFAFSKMFKKNYGMPPSDYRKTFCK